MTTYLDIIRTYRPQRQNNPPGADEPLAKPRRDDAAGPARSAGAGRNKQKGNRALQVEDVLAEIGRTGSGPAKALGTYLEKPNTERLGWLTKAVLQSRTRGIDGWERFVPVVKEAATNAGDEPTDGRQEG